MNPVNPLLCDGSEAECFCPWRLFPCFGCLSFCQLLLFLIDETFNLDSLKPYYAEFV